MQVTVRFGAHKHGITAAVGATLTRANLAHLLQHLPKIAVPGCDEGTAPAPRQTA